VAGAVTTRRLDDWAASGAAINVAPVSHDEDWAIAAALRLRPPDDAPTSGPVAASVSSRRLALACAGVTRTLAVAGTRVSLGDRVVDVVLHAPDADGWRAVDVDGVRRRRLVVDDGARVHVARDAAVHVFEEPSPFPQPDATAAARVARAPVAGVVAQVSVEVGQRVAAGQPLVCVEAMKMEMWLNAAAEGVVAAVRVAPRDTVASGAVLVELDLDLDATETR
jgi:geranyl-CoA carboxylase alpha subunit